MTKHEKPNISDAEAHASIVRKALDPDWVPGTREQEIAVYRAFDCLLAENAHADKLAEALYDVLAIAHRIRGGDNVGEEWYVVTEYAQNLLNAHVAQAKHKS